MTKSFARRHPGKISLVLAILTGAGIPAAAADRILIFAGQSNMVGIGSANVPPSTADQAVIPNVQGFYTNSYCDGVGSSWDPGRTAPERFGEHSYISYEGGDYGNAARWATAPYSTSVGQRTVGGTWQPYQWWKPTWVGKNPLTGADYTYIKTSGAGTRGLGEFYNIGINPGDAHSNANDYNNSPQVTIRIYGPELGAARAISAAYPADRFWIVKYAYGGMSLAAKPGYDWSPTSANECYQGMKEWVRAAQNSLPGAAAGATIAGFFWMQGENDAGVTADANAYNTNLTALLAQIRTDFGTNLPVVIGKVHPSCPGGAGTVAVRAAQDAVAIADGHAVAVETSTLTIVNPEWSGGNAGIQVAGVYHFDAASIVRLGNSMGTAWASLTTVVTNTAPAVEAMVNQSITLPGMATLQASVRDDGLPAPSTLTYAWTTVSGPGIVVLRSTTARDTTASFSAAGVYTLRLSASDGALTGSNTVVVTVAATSTGNTAPVVDPMGNQAIMLPALANLQGTVRDDGLPVPSALTYAWTMVSGPGTVVFGSPTVRSSTAGFSTAGVYILRLSASDGALTSSSTVVVTVAAATIPPPISTTPPKESSDKGGCGAGSLAAMILTGLSLALFGWRRP